MMERPKFIEFRDTIERYLKDKLPDVPKATLMEIVTFVTSMAIIWTNDTIAERDEMWRHEMKKGKVRRSLGQINRESENEDE